MSAGPPEPAGALPASVRMQQSTVEKVERWQKRQVLLVILFFITKSNISCFLFFDFGAQGLCDRGSGRDGLRSSGSRGAEEG